MVHVLGATDFWPTSTDHQEYLCDTLTLDDLIQKAKEKWPDVEFDKITIELEHIHTHHLTYDRYDSGDWTNFIVLRRSS